MLKSQALSFRLRLVSALFTLAISWAAASPSWAEAPYPPVLMFTLPTLSLDGLVSFEPPLTSHLSIFLAGGIVGAYTAGGGTIVGRPGVIIEGRVYFREDEHVGWYFGVSAEHSYIINYEQVGIIPSIKFAYKHQSTRFFAVEVYFSFSAPFYYDYKDKYERKFEYGWLPAMTMGVRLVFDTYGPVRARG